MTLTGNAATIASFLSGKGLSAAGVAGVLGGLQAESGLNPSARNASSGATGIAQWLGSRLSALEGLAHTMGASSGSLSVQLNFLWQELSSPQYASLLHTLQTTTDPQAAARDWVNLFERPGPGGDASAPANALTFFNGGVPGGAGNPGLGDTGGGTENTGSGISSNPWTQGLLGGFGATLGADPGAVGQAATGQTPGPFKTIEGVGEGIASIAQDFVTMLNLMSELFKASNWLRIGSFIMGLVCFIGGFLMLKGAAL